LAADHEVLVPGNGNGSPPSQEEAAARQFAREILQRGYTAREASLLVLVAAARRRGEGGKVMLQEALRVMRAFQEAGTR